MSNWDKRYTDRVQLLVEILPLLTSEPNFALKGGTAINLFEHDLPRLSVDIDLTWLPVDSYAQGLQDIGAAFKRLAKRLVAAPLRLQVQTSATQGTGTATRLIASRGRARVQIETSPVMRGAVHPVRQMHVSHQVEDAFGFATAQVLDFADLYAGKMAAALSRQHPRDLFDLGAMLQDDRADELLWRTFLVYLSCSPKPAWELLDPAEPQGFDTLFESHFNGMTAQPTSVEELLDNRTQLLSRMTGWLDASSVAFLESLENENPNFELIGLPHALDLPGVQRKLQNLGQRSDVKRKADQQLLDETLTRMRASAGHQLGEEPMP